MLHATMTAGNLRPATTTMKRTLTSKGMGAVRLPFTIIPTPATIQEMPTSAVNSYPVPLDIVHEPTPSCVIPISTPQLNVSRGGRLVAQAIIMSQGLDLSADQAYYPFEGGTTLREAYAFLRLNDYILIKGGRIQRTAAGYQLTLWQCGAESIDTQDVRELLQCNYPAPTVVAPVREAMAPLPPKPIPLQGVGFYAALEYGLDLDDIRSDQWEPIRFPRNIDQQTIYLGDLTLDDRTADVWWSTAIGCYLCQYRPTPEAT
jgi:hypothetical protein